MTRDELIVQAAVRKDLLTRAEGDEALAAARADGRDVSGLLVERGILTQRTVATLRRDVVRLESSTGEATKIVPPPDPDATTLTRPPGDPDATAPVDPSILPVATPRAPDPERLGEYEVVERLGEGGMGTVYRARQVSLDRAVALKVISNKFAADDEARQRFEREAKVAAKINHPNVITIHQVGRDQGRVYMAMELVTGGDAEDLVQAEGGTLAEARALTLIRDCCRGLVEIERQGLIHRDIKPANLFLTADGSAKLADLGMARSQAGDDRVTQSGVIVGTPAYMSPEQAEGHECDIRADIYALGASLYRLCVGHPPFEGSSALRVMTKVLNDPVPDPRRGNPRISGTTAVLIRKCLAKKPDNRYASAADLLKALDEALAELASPPKKRIGVQPCALLILFLTAGCFLCSGLFSFLTMAEGSRALDYLQTAHPVLPAELATATGSVFVESVTLTPPPQLEPELLDAKGDVYLVTRTLISHPDMVDRTPKVHTAEGVRVGGIPLALSEGMALHGLDRVEKDPTEPANADWTGISFDETVTLAGEVTGGELRCSLLTTEASKREVIERLHSKVGPNRILGPLCTLLGMLGLGLCVLLVLRRR